MDDLDHALAHTAALEARIERLEALLKPFSDLLDRPWQDKAASIKAVRNGGFISELQAVRLDDVLRARAALDGKEGP